MAPVTPELRLESSDVIMSDHPHAVQLALVPTVPTPAVSLTNLTPFQPHSPNSRFCSEHKITHKYMLPKQMLITKRQC